MTDVPETETEPEESGGTNGRSLAAPDMFADPENDSASCRHYAWLAAQGHSVDPNDYPLSIIGAEQYARAHGIQHFSGREIALPARPELWISCCPDSLYDPPSGLPMALPARAYWPRWVAALSIVDEMRRLIGEPIRLAHGWRPETYNRRLGGKPGSDHLTACAWDFDVPSGRCRDLVLTRLGELYLGGRLGMSVGWHSGPGRRFHVGVLAPRTVDLGRQRNWDYDRSNRDWLSSYIRGVR